ncbi:MAG: hypothetical protein LUH10_11080 [Tannerellaceae bacterium]|nr:hypothetical protein [Tannerellaceae bacterium]
MKTDRQRLIDDLSIHRRITLGLAAKRQTNYEKYLLFAELKNYLSLTLSFSDVELTCFDLLKGFKIPLDFIDGCYMSATCFFFSIRRKKLYVIDYRKPDIHIWLIQPALYYWLLPYSFYFYKYRHLLKRIFSRP